MSDEVSTLVEAIRSAIESRMVETHTAMPATVLSFDATKQTVSVQPSIKSKFTDGTVQALPVISNVPVHFPRAAKGGVRFPLAAGDQVMLVFAERSLDVWKSKGGTVDPLEGRKFNLSDAVAYPGLFSPAAAEGSFPTANMELKWGSAKIILQESGAVEVQGTSFAFTGTGGELVDFMSQLAQLGSEVSNSGGPTANAAQWTALKAQIDALKG